MPAGVEDRHVDAAERLLDRGHRAFDRRTIGDVERDTRARPRRGARAVGRERFEAIRATGADRQPRATVGERRDQRLADAGARAGEPDARVLELHAASMRSATIRRRSVATSGR